MHAERIGQIERGRRYVQNELHGDVPIILADGAGDRITIYSTRDLPGYRLQDGLWVRTVQDPEFSDWGCIRLAESPRYVRFWQTRTYQDDHGTVVEETPRPPAPYQRFLGLDRLQESGYAFVSTGALRASINEPHPTDTFPEDALIVHEATHGVGMPHMEEMYPPEEARVLDEALAIFMERSFVAGHRPAFLSEWDRLVRQIASDTDPVHREAYGMVFDPRRQAQLQLMKETLALFQDRGVL
ncbi:MAG: hypothetical protein HY520_01330 [Candidatus Aenigmarchaeota archaeon]|nr:hypothetical protein [Candidatus Aenigmarchaeota archaeon]